MNFPAELKAKIYNSVVPIICGGERGTAFFISPDTLLTARHIIVDYIDSNCGEEILINIGEKILCRPTYLSEDGDNIDAILLKCIDYASPYYLNLLSANFVEEAKLLIIGYPKEFGYCSNLISLDVCNRLEVDNQEYDRTVIRLDTLAFTSYKGFSGSPVINEKGSAVGVVLTQQNQGIGYLSIKKLSNLLEQQQIDFRKDWQSEDLSPLGRGTSQKQVEEAVRYASIRYNRDLHIRDINFDEKINAFCNYDEISQITSKLKNIESQAYNLYIDSENEDLQYKKGNYGDLKKYLRIWNSKDTSNNFDAKRFYEGNYDTLEDLIYKWELGRRNRMIVTANAGYGKTHYMCATAERLSKKMNTYLLFGSKFIVGKKFSEQLIEMMGLGNKTLEELNDKAKCLNENAIIIIDAINEGADNAFWQIAVNSINNEYEKFQNIKFIFTFRENESKIDINNWCEISFKGFENRTKDAIEKYFSYYKIDVTDDFKQKYYKEFNEPLFLSIFSQVFQYEKLNYVNELTHSEIFRLYIYFRNSVISNKVDEDPYLNITYRYLDKLANYSLYYKQCSDIPRDKARHYSNQICRNRKWSESLLYWALRENLLLETKQDGNAVMFGYQKLGDFLMADVFTRNKMSDEDKINCIINWSKEKKYRSFIVALFTDWNLIPKLLAKDLDSNLVSIILESLKNHGKNYYAIIDWLASSDLPSVDGLLNYFDKLPLSYFNNIHEKLLDMKLANRDVIWTSDVNKLYSKYDPNSFDRSIDLDLFHDDDRKKYLIFICWLSTSSYPIIRHHVTKRLVILFKQDDNLMELAITQFKECDDPYVMQTITCAIYGYLLSKRNKNVANNIASVIKSNLYSEKNIPNDILIRQWSLLIFQYTDYLNNNTSLQDTIKPPFNSEDPNKLIIDNDTKTNEKYFGDSWGSQKLYDTLYGFSDFNRYILGSNFYDSSTVFVSIDNMGKIHNIEIKYMQRIMANIVKYQLKWNEELGKLDNNISSEGRYNNKIERFGKKYLWLALYRLDAMMCDNFRMVDNSQYITSITPNDIVETPYPWYTKEYSHIDPSVIDNAQPHILTTTSFEINSITNMTNEEWLKDDTPINNPRLILGDNNEWIVLSCYDGYEIKNGEAKKDFFLFTNAAFVKNEDLDTYNEWAKEQNFYGRWMPERRNGSIDYLWNEYPWSDTYKRTIANISLSEKPRTCPVNIYLSYESQLQEEWGFLNESQTELTEVKAPNHDMMEKLKLYTAERGVIRDTANNAEVAVNFKMDKFQGLAIKQEYLDKYLFENNFSMVYYTLGEKYILGNNSQSVGKLQELSGAFYYKNGKIETIQEMKIKNNKD